LQLSVLANASKNAEELTSLRADFSKSKGVALSNDLYQGAGEQLIPQMSFDPTNAKPAQLVHEAKAETLKLFVRGFAVDELKLLEGLVRVSQRRSPRLELLDFHNSKSADVVLIDTKDAAALTWAHMQAWLHDKAVIWIGADKVPEGHTAIKRPVQWSILPMLLARALEHGPGTAAAYDSSHGGLHSSYAGLNSSHSGLNSLHAPLNSSHTGLNSSHAALSSSHASLNREPAPITQMARPILIVDDSLAVRAHLRSLLEASGFVVSDADSVQHALFILSRQSFDCVLMDVMMPGIDGYEGCRQVKTILRGNRFTPVVMLTSKSSPFDRIRGKMAGCDAYLTKPVDPKQLGDVLAQQFNAMQQDISH
jgi:two-component system, cell cycle response regulator